ncbi:MAG: hypothetical protein KDK25_12105 [Leptospiraceae bacterium]|nr:hypothetical protein [Leptospiraceae bacterium]MCB1171076.1 hypothetical protein [Leptospiraceae bacterium]
MSREHFDRLKSEAQSLSAGFVFSDRITYALFRAIQNYSSLDHARTRSIFTLGSPIPDIANLEYSKQELRAALIRLVDEGLASQAFLLDFDAAKKEVRLIPCYVSRPSGPDSSSYGIFEELMRQSAMSLESYSEASPALEKDALRKLLLADIQGSLANQTTMLADLVFNPLILVNPVHFDLTPPASMLEDAKRIIVETLRKRGNVPEIAGLGFLRSRKDEIVTRFEIASEVLREQSMVLAGTNAELANELLRISSDEEKYLNRRFMPIPTEFSLRRANLFKATFPAASEGKSVPGAITCEIVLRTAEGANRHYTTRWEKEMEEILNSILEPFRRPGAHPTQQIRFFPESVLDEIPPFVWQKLVSSSSLLHSQWQTKSGSIEILIKREPSVVRHLVDEYPNLPPSEFWKILALRTIIDGHEEVFNPLFRRKDFKRSYGDLLRLAYWPLIPWYVRILIILGFKGMQDYGFAKAKARIMEEQAQLAEENRKRRDDAFLTRKKSPGFSGPEGSGSSSEPRDAMPIGRKVELVMDHLYFVQLKPPTISELISMVEGVPASDLEQHLKDEGYRFIESEDGEIVLYPVDQTWRTRAARLRRLYSEDDEDLSPAVQARVKALNKLLSRSFSDAKKGGSGSRNAAREDEPVLY